MGPDSHKLILGYILVGLTQSSGPSSNTEIFYVIVKEDCPHLQYRHFDVCTILQHPTFAVLSAPILTGVSLLVKNSRRVEKIIL